VKKAFDVSLVRDGTPGQQMGRREDGVSNRNWLLGLKDTRYPLNVIYHQRFRHACLAF
jgi:hypothetical protein